MYALAWMLLGVEAYCPVGKYCTWLQCTNGDHCNVYDKETDSYSNWDCCNKVGAKRLRCPSRYPIMCANPTGCHGDHCCACRAELCEKEQGGIRKDCPKLEVGCPLSGQDFHLECKDGSTCDVREGRKWACCSDRGGRQKCPPSQPFMCRDTSPNCGNDHCCSDEKSWCECHGGGLLPETECVGKCPTTSVPNQLGCLSGFQCDITDNGGRCCEDQGGRQKCPPNFPFMCQDFSCNGEHCCGQKEQCDNDYGGIVQPGNCPTVKPICPVDDEGTFLECLSGDKCRVYDPVTKTFSNWDCCNIGGRGGRHKCPRVYPYMCANKNVPACDNDYCCAEHAHICDDYGGLLQETDCPQPPKACPVSPQDNMLTCMDGTTCDVTQDPLAFGCCSFGHGGKKNCPANFPFLCAQPSAECQNERCCAFVASYCINFAGGVLNVNSCPGETCSDYRCHVGYHWVENYQGKSCSSASTGYCTNQHCCVETNPPISCATYTCDISQGLVSVSNPASVNCPNRVCQPSYCCIKTCRNYPCVSGDGWKPSAETETATCPSSGCSHSECCIRTCANYQCDIGLGLQTKRDSENLRCANAQCTADECCRKTCHNYNCGSDYRLKRGAGDLDCPSGGCSVDICCVPTCGTYQTCDAGAGWVALPNPGSIQCSSGGCGQDSCCKQTCLNYQCRNEAGYRLRENPGKLTCSSRGCTNSYCCQPTCAFFTCGSGYKPHPNAASRDCAAGGCTQQYCCVETCENFGSCDSSEGLVLRDNPASLVCPSSGGCAYDLCCERTCSNYKCVSTSSTESTLKPNAHNIQCPIGGCTSDICCVDTRIESCATWISDGNSCQEYYKQVDDLAGQECSGASCNHGLCCRRTCQGWISEVGCPNSHVSINNGITRMCHLDDTDCSSKCCDQTCDSWLSSSGGCPNYHIPLRSAGSSALDEFLSPADQCCVPTCEAWLDKNECEKGYVAIDDASSIETAGGSGSTEKCCKPTCFAWLKDNQCKEYYKQVAEPTSLVCGSGAEKCDYQRCCVPSCGVFVDGTCLPNTKRKENLLDVECKDCDSLDKQKCCEPTCSLWEVDGGKCPTNWLRKSGLSDIACHKDGTCDEKSCCEPTCGVWFDEGNQCASGARRSSPHTVRCSGGDCNQYCCMESIPCSTWFESGSCPNYHMSKIGANTITCIDDVGGDSCESKCCTSTCEGWFESSGECDAKWVRKFAPSSIPCENCDTKQCCQPTCGSWTASGNACDDASYMLDTMDGFACGSNGNSDDEFCATKCCQPSCAKWLASNQCEDYDDRTPRANPNSIKCIGQGCNHVLCCERTCKSWFRESVDNLCDAYSERLPDLSCDEAGSQCGRERCCAASKCTLVSKCPSGEIRSPDTKCDVLSSCNVKDCCTCSTSIEQGESPCVYDKVCRDDSTRGSITCQELRECGSGFDAMVSERCRCVESGSSDYGDNDTCQDELKHHCFSNKPSGSRCYPDCNDGYNEDSCACGSSVCGAGGDCSGYASGGRICTEARAVEGDNSGINWLIVASATLPLLLFLCCLICVCHRQAKAKKKSDQGDWVKEGNMNGRKMTTRGSVKDKKLQGSGSSSKLPASMKPSDSQRSKKSRKSFASPALSETSQRSLSQSRQTRKSHQSSSQSTRPGDSSGMSKRHSKQGATNRSSQSGKSQERSNSRSLSRSKLPNERSNSQSRKPEKKSNGRSNSQSKKQNAGQRSAPPARPRGGRSGSQSSQGSRGKFTGSSPPALASSTKKGAAPKSRRSRKSGGGRGRAQNLE